jgi:hypothetical protein
MWSETNNAVRMYKSHNSKQKEAIKDQNEAKRWYLMPSWKEMYINILIEYITKTEHRQTDQNI